MNIVEFSPQDHYTGQYVGGTFIVSIRVYSYKYNVYSYKYNVFSEPHELVFTCGMLCRNLSASGDDGVRDALVKEDVMTVLSALLKEVC